MSDLKEVFGEYKAIERAKKKFDKDINQLENDLYKQKNTKYPDERAEEIRKEKIKKLENQIATRKEKYQQQLKKGYKREFEKIKATSGYGESTATETETQIKHLEGKSKAEIQMKANEFKENGNYEGLRLLNKKMSKGEMPVVNLDYESFDSKIEQLDNYFKGKYRQTTSRIGGEKEAVGELKEELGLI